MSTPANVTAASVLSAGMQTGLDQSYAALDRLLAQLG
jgi:hypothetical protein